MKKKNFYLALAAIIMVSALALAGVRFFSGEDSWVCQNGEWVKHGSPSSAKPTSACPGAKTEVEVVNERLSNDMGKEPASPDDVLVEDPVIGSDIASPVTIKGQARGTWYFEASFPIELIDEGGKVLGTGVAQAQSDWMTEEYVPFKAEISFGPVTAKTGYLVFRKDNPSGDPDLDRAYRLPVNFSPNGEASVKEETMVVAAYFGNEDLNPGAADCSLVYPVERRIPKTLGVGRAALEETLKGPTQEELDKRYYTSINPGVKINSLSISSTTANVDLSENLEEGVGGSCRVAAIRAQIEQTLKQFLVMQPVIISVNGRTEDILQP